MKLELSDDNAYYAINSFRQKFLYKIVKKKSMANFFITGYRVHELAM